MARTSSKWQINSRKMMGTTKYGNKLMGMSKKGKMIEFLKMIKMMGISQNGNFSENSKNQIYWGNFRYWGRFRYLINPGKFQ
jgi:hypothetical protein